MKWALIDNQEIIQNIIAYDGVSEFLPPEGLTLNQVNDWCLIGQNINITQSEVKDLLTCEAQ